MVNQHSDVVHSGEHHVPNNLPILPKLGRVNCPMRYSGLDNTGHETQYAVKSTVAGIVALGFTFANAPYAFYQPIEEKDGWQKFKAACGEVSIPVNDYRRLLSVSKRTSRIREQPSRGVAYVQ